MKKPEEKSCMDIDLEQGEEAKRTPKIIVENGRNYLEKERFHIIFNAINNNANSLGIPTVEINREGDIFVGQIIKNKDGVKTPINCWLKAQDKNDFPKN